jgi:general secretion pathway protein D
MILLKSLIARFDTLTAPRAGRGTDSRLPIAALLTIALLGTGCVAGKAFRQGEAASQAGNLDEAVAAYRKAVQAAPDNANYKIALQRAMIAASRSHLDKARDFEQKDQLEAALGEYRQASEYDPSNRQATAKVAELDRTIRQRVEATRPRPQIEQMRERARAASQPPALISLTTPLPRIRYNNTSLKDVLNSIADVTGINITYDREVTDRQITVQLDGATLEQALNQIMTMNQLSYKVINERSIFVFPDTPPKHAQYDEQVVRTFYVSHADATELTQILSTIIRLPGIAVQPAIVANKTSNTITVRATSSVVQIIERIIQQNDKPRAEIVIDVEILEVDRSRAKDYGLNLTDYAVGAIFSPEVSPSATTTPPPATTPSTPSTNAVTPAAPSSQNTGRSTSPTQVASPPAFNLNTISRGFTTADFYLAVPTAIVRFLESDNRTKVVAKPQLRGAEGMKLSLNLGQRIPVISTSYTPIATGGAGVNPLSSYQYQDVGVNLDMTPTVTLEGDIRLDITIDDSQVGADKTVAGVTVPSFVQRKVTTRLRLRDGESNLLAGLLLEQEQNQVSGFPGAIRLPVFRQLFSRNQVTNDQTDIVMLLTPHIVRSHEITEDDLKPIYIGSQQNLGVGGPPPLIQPPPAAAEVAAQQPGTPAAPPVGAQPAYGGSTTPGTIRGPSGQPVALPPGSSPVPGTVAVPQPQQQTPPNVVAVPAEPTAQPAPTPPPPGAAPATPAPTPAAPAPTTPAPTTATPPAAEPAAPGPTTTPGIGLAQIILSPPGPTFRVGGGPYTVPISITEATRLSTLTLTLTFDATKLRVRSVNEGTFMRAGGVNVTFTQQVNGNRIDITLARAADATGATGTGLLAAVLFDAIAPGSVTLTVSGAATGPGGAAMGLRFAPVTVNVQ